MVFQPSIGLQFDYATLKVRHDRATKEQLEVAKKNFEAIEAELLSLVEAMPMYKVMCPEMALWRSTAEKNLLEGQKQEAAKGPSPAEKLLCVI